MAYISKIPKSTLSAISKASNVSLSFQEIRRSSSQASKVNKLIVAYQNESLKTSLLNPLTSHVVNETELERYGLDKEEIVTYKGRELTVTDLVKSLQYSSCNGLKVDFSAVECNEEVEWFQSIEKRNNSLDDKRKVEIGKILVESQCLDDFLAKKFPSLKRYSGEGAEGMLVLVHHLLQAFASKNVQECIIGMPHRGRNNLLQGELSFPMELMLNKIKGNSEFPSDVLYTASGDVLSHLNTSTTCQYDDGSIKVNLLPNSSHLEAVNPVAMGKCRARQQTLDSERYSKGLISDKVTNILIHGDAAFTGQGIVMECLNMSQLPNFDVGGSIHIIVNNQIGFTTPPEIGRSCSHASDPCKMINSPVIRVNGESIPALIQAAHISAEYRIKFQKDISIDMLCYRKWGHNELDDPSFTQPSMYDVISKKDPLSRSYCDQLISEGLVNEIEVASWNDEEMERLEGCLKRSSKYETRDFFLSPKSSWSEMKVASGDHVTTWDTGCNLQLLRFIASKSVETPNHFHVHPTLAKMHVKGRREKVENGKTLDWSTAEAMALGSLLLQDFNIRFCGQDAQRGTFSHRHAALTCQNSEKKFIPLNNLHDKQGLLEIVSSPLSEESVLGFEYGMSIESPRRLCIWEAQFGDFFNGAQILLDAFVMSGEAKWMYQSGLVILLPHGFDGSGSEHSSCRIERFLQCSNSSEIESDSDAVNVSICSPTTSAQYFHLLRRQMIRNFRKPLIIATPKTLLRSQNAASQLDLFQPGTSFQPVIGWKTSNPLAVDKMVLTSGKHYFTLLEERERLIREEKRLDLENCSIIRVEELCPFPVEHLANELKQFPNISTLIWSQEEPRNAGAWSFVAPRMENLLGIKLQYAGRPTHAAVASGIGSIHQAEKKSILRDTFQ